MSNRWIITSHKFVEHTDVDTALAELHRLTEAYPKKVFRMYRVKAVAAPPEEPASPPSAAPAEQ